VPIEKQSQGYACLNQRCCVAMISFVKGKFNFLAAFCIVALFFITVAIMNANYMYKKIKKYNTRILSHRRDDVLLGFMVAFTVILGVLVKVGMPEGPRGMPEPKILEVLNSNGNLTSLEVEKDVGIGRLDQEGWWNFNRIDLFRSLDDSIIFEKHAEVTIASTPANGEFRLTAAIDAGRNLTALISNKPGVIKVSGSTSQVEEALSFLEFRAGCIFDPNLSLDMNFTVGSQMRDLQSLNNSQVQVH
jgi:amino acid transporter